MFTAWVYASRSRRSISIRCAPSTVYRMNLCASGSNCDAALFARVTACRLRSSSAAPADRETPNTRTDSDLRSHGAIPHWTARRNEFKLMFSMAMDAISASWIRIARSLSENLAGVLVRHLHKSDTIVRCGPSEVPPGISSSVGAVSFDKRADDAFAPISERAWLSTIRSTSSTAIRRR